MSFKIVSCVSPDFFDAIPLFTPSWHANSGASSIEIHLIDGGSWYENIILRNQVMRDEVLKQNKDQEGVELLVFLDIDCFVVSPLGGMSGTQDQSYPISVARWPEPNMGAVYVRPFAYDRDRWVDLFHEVTSKVQKRCRDKSIQGTSKQKGRFGDQYIWWDILKGLEREGMLGKLDMTYNFCYQPEQWKRKLEEFHKRVRVIHLKGRGRWLQQPHIREKLKQVDQLLPGLVPEWARQKLQKSV